MSKHSHGRLLSAVHSEVDERARHGLARWKARVLGLFPGLWAWLRYRMRQKHPLVPLDGGEGVARMHALGGATRIAVTGDWGDGSDNARRVAAAMEALQPEYTIHLGDIYSVGSEEEVRHNFLGEEGGVAWPVGRFGALAVPGNHEYQSGAHAFYNLAMRKHLGVRASEDGPRVPQPATYFALESGHWSIVGLDTGYHSVKKFPWELAVKVLNWVPLLSRAPLIRRLRTKLPSVIVRWLEPRLATGKAMVVLSHHQPVTSLDRRGSHPRPAQQVAGLAGGRQVVWLCGHGHRLEVHAPATFGDLTVHARTVGHGHRTDVVRLRPRYELLVYADNRAAPDRRKQGYPGFTVLTFEGPRLTVDYVALAAGDAPEVVFREAFEAREGDARLAAQSHAIGDGLFAAGLADSAEDLPVALDPAVSPSAEG